jgi:tetratricopeptide (TPR) repeat protein
MTRSRNTRVVCYLVPATIVTMCWLALSSAEAQTPQQIDWCNNRGGSPTIDQRIAGCTAAVEAGQSSSRLLALAFSNRCLAYADKGDNDRAITDCSESIRLEPTNVAAFIKWCYAYNNKAEFDFAIVDCSEAVRLNPTIDASFTNRCQAYNGKREFERAIADCTEVIRLNPSGGFAFINRCNSEQGGI